MDISPREAKEKLSELRFKFKTNQLSSKEAHRLGKPYLEVYNNFAKETAKKYGVKPKLIKDNLIYW